MYCSGCGQPIAPNQALCAHCGRPAVQVPAYAAAGFPTAALVPYNRVQRHIQTVAILWLAYSLFSVVAILVLLPFVSHFFGHGGHGFGVSSDFHLPMPLHWFLPLVATFVYLRAFLGTMVGIGLLRRERWGRILALVVSILALFKFPFGTALGIYTLWVLVPAQSAQEYEKISGR